jgi:glutamate N-acetyltransferase/amino-acid N-acetyltransferase
MTTDTFPKLATRQAKIGERTVTLNGFLKGSGMIAPTWRPCWASSSPTPRSRAAVLQKLVTDAADKSLNCVTVDGDTSTSDTCCSPPPAPPATRRSRRPTIPS